ncbi:MAG: Lrp/AsnC family transcriptional regulator [Ilumatobacteraceae bacterium]
MDVDIIDFLILDGRSTTRQIAQGIGLRENTVAQRLKRLMERDIVRVRAAIDWRTAGFTASHLLFLRVEDRPVREVITEIYDLPHQTQSACRVFGSVDIITRVLAPDLAGVAEHVEHGLGSIEGVSVVLALPEVATYKHPNNFHAVPPLDVEVPALPDPPIPLDELDRSLVKLLVHDARSPWRQVARQLDVSESTVRARVRRLEDSGLVRLIAQIDPISAGADVEYAWIGVRVRDGRRADVVRLLVTQADVNEVSTTVGPYDVLAFVGVRSPRRLARILDDLRGVGGASTTDAWAVSTVTMSGFPWIRFEGLLSSVHQGP